MIISFCSFLYVMMKLNKNQLWPLMETDETSQKNNTNLPKRDHEVYFKMLMNNKTKIKRNRYE